MRTVPLYRRSGHVSGGVIRASFYMVTHSMDEQSVDQHLKTDTLLHGITDIKMKVDLHVLQS